jgi:hypothetical protein
MTEATLEIGAEMKDGTIFAGLTPDGKQQIYAMPKDLTTTLGFKTMSFNKAAKLVKKLNADKFLGYDDWQIPAVENLRILQENQNKRSLKGTFKTASSSGPNFPVWYWSSTPSRVVPYDVASVRFSHGGEFWSSKDDSRLSCRPVRLVPTSSPSLG